MLPGPTTMSITIRTMTLDDVGTVSDLVTYLEKELVTEITTKATTPGQQTTTTAPVTVREISASPRGLAVGKRCGEDAEAKCGVKATTAES